MKNKTTEKIKIWGMVQGVGFRPFVAKIAEEMKLKGKVQNVGGLVHIFVTGQKEEIDNFVERISIEKKRPIEIIHMEREEIEYMDFKEFNIAHSQETTSEIIIIPPDIATCPSCQEEFCFNENRRHRHAFISCMLCGPRNTIINSLPYDRERTTMENFQMCLACKKEYEDIRDRRYHAQTISCKDCGPSLLMKRKDEKVEDCEEKIIDEIKEKISSGGVVAFKAVGGYNLICEYGNEEAERKLRKIKGREKKPFAVMFSNVKEARETSVINKEEESLLESSARPIVLVKEKENGLEGAKHIGVFLPSIAAQEMILEACKSPLIFTSCNPSSSPIIADDQEMIEFFRENEIDLLVYNERRIISHIDDSVIRLIDGKPQIIRRAKGYAPMPLYLSEGRGEILAMGGDLKTTFAISKGSLVYPSQYFGDMDNEKLQAAYVESLQRMKKIFGINPQSIACDKHPLYWTRKKAIEIANEHNMKVIEVQHHHAHIGSVMAEHNIEEKVIGIAFDGTGYGDDNNIWGGEVLICQGGDYERFSHLQYETYLGGDAMATEAWKVAYALTQNKKYKAEENQCQLVDRDKEEKEKDIEKDLKQRTFSIDISDIIKYAYENKTLEKYMTYEQSEIMQGALKGEINTIKSSSMGRLFDGVAALLGICGRNSYEGECAISLEDEATKVVKEFDGKGKEKFSNPQEKRRAELALEFHKKIGQKIKEEAIKAREIHDTDIVALSGGVFQNEILMNESLKLLRKEGFVVYHNVMVSPNDGGLSLGQIFIASHKTNNTYIRKG